MRQFCLFRSVVRDVVRVLACAVMAWGVSSCEDDALEGYQAGGPLVFEVGDPGSWTNGMVRSSVQDIRIKRMSQPAGEKPLYLVTEIAEAVVDTAASETLTRGKPVTSGGDFPGECFGLSAICYTGDWPEGEKENSWTTNFAHDMKVSAKDGKPQDDKLDWLGSGNIRFFAYSPYSGVEKSPITHSAAGTKGVPTLTYTVPADVTRQPDLVVAVADCKGDGSGTEGGKVKLAFKHALTAVTLKTGKDMLAGTVTKITISGVRGQGSYKIGAGEWTPSGEATSFDIKKNIDLPEDKGSNDKNIDTKPDVSLNTGEYTFMMIPQTLPQGAKLVVEFTDNLTKVKRTLTADLGGKEWPLGKQVIYSISSTGIIIEPVVEMKINRDGVWPNGGNLLSKNMKTAANMYEREMTSDEKNAYLPVSGYLRDIDIKGYVRVVQKAAGTDEAKMQTLGLDAFKVQYKVSGDSDWKDAAWKKSAAAKASESKNEYVKGALLLSAQPQFEATRKYFNQGYNGGHPWLTPAQSDMLTKDGKGTEDEPWDLVQNNPIKKESANCYIVNDHGYYMFPVCYGNTYGRSDKLPYTGPSGDAPDVVEYALGEFVGHDDMPITGQNIPGVVKAELLWQDSPELVTDVELIPASLGKGGFPWVRFRVLPETINQGNAVIAVRNSGGTIVWSWHVWVTHHDWAEESLYASGTREDNTTYMLTPCNLGYCEPHGGDASRKVQMRFLATMPDGSEVAVKDFKMDGGPAPDKNGVCEFTQPEIVASIAGDNTYYQWGRKDPMLPGIYDATIKNSAEDDQFNMENKVFYSTVGNKIDTEDTGQSIGGSIQAPHHFFIHKRPEDGSVVDDFLRRHWHNGEDAPYKKKSIMNYWHSQLDKASGTYTKESPNGANVYKTIYDPCPAGYKVPSPNVFTVFSGGKAGSLFFSKDAVNGAHVSENNVRIGWTLDNGKVFFPATGLRDMGIVNRETEWGTWPAHADVAFVASACFTADDITNASAVLFYLDNRELNKGNDAKIIVSGRTNNAYGFTIRPVLDN